MRALAPLFLLALLAAAPAVPHYATFGRWIVACDNIRTCEARGFDDSMQADLRVVRDAGPAAARITLTVREGPVPDELRLDGAPLVLAPPAWVANGAEGTVSTDDPAAVAAFLQAARSAHSLVVGDNSVPLDGMVAALLRVDAVQGRANTPTPLLATKGNNGVAGADGLPARPAWITPPPLANPATLMVRARRAEAAVLAREECDRTDADEAYALDDRTAIVLLPCRNYAYQSSSLVVIVPRDGSAPRLFQPKLLFDKTATTLFVEAGFDPDRGMLGTSAKGRGLADCGSSASWVWSAGAFRLVEMTLLDACGSARSGDWPLLYRTAPHH